MHFYWPPRKTEHTLKYDPHTDQITLQLVGGDFGECHASEEKPAVTEDASAATTSANIPASTVPAERIIPADEQQVVVVVIKSEPRPNSISSSSSQTTTADDAFDQRDYDMLRIHYLQPKVRKNEEIPSGMRLRKRKAPAAIDGKTEVKATNSSSG